MNFPKQLPLLFFLFLIAFIPISKAQTDAALSAINYPASTSCTAYSAKDSIQITVKNTGSVKIDSFKVSYLLDNNTAVVDKVVATLATGASLKYTFKGSVDLSGNGYHKIKVYVTAVNDATKSNDTATITIFNRIAKFPYYENFETNDGGYYGDGTYPSWAYGSPSKGTMTKAGQGKNCWTNGYLTGTYNAYENSNLNFPCFDFSKLKAPQITYLMHCQIEINYENVWLEYSTNNGSTWTKLGSSSDPVNCNTENWYSVSGGWSGSSGGCFSGCGSASYCGKWVEVKHCLDNLGGKSNVIMRLRFTGGFTCQKEGYAIDSVVIGESSLKSDFSNTEVCATNTTQFTDKSTCAKSWKWDFGDGVGTSTAQNPKYVYKKGGKYKVKLVTTNYCGRTDTLIKTVNSFALPVVSINPLVKSVFCKDDPTFTLSATPLGGVFRINGKVVTKVNPATTDTGIYSAIYTFYDTNLCVNSDTITFSIKDKPTPKITGLLSNYCLQQQVFTLSGTPAGGIFTIDGKTVTSFDAKALGAGSHKVVYTYTNGAGCTGIDSFRLSISKEPFVKITGLNNSYCMDAAPFTLQANPPGGKFYIDGVLNSNFDPGALGTGSHIIRYKYITSSGCGGEDSAEVEVLPLPPVSISNVNASYCKNELKVTLKGSPSGGIFTIDGSAVTVLDPAKLSVGKHVVIYRYTAINGCEGSATKIITIKAMPALSFDNLDKHYCSDAAAVTITASPSGGVLRINGKINSIIDPATLPLGTVKLSYYFKDPGTGCFDSILYETEIVKLPVASISGLGARYCIMDLSTKLNGNPIGGSFTIDGKAATDFLPSAVGIGQHTVNYTFTDSNGCSASTSAQVEVYGSPIGKIQPRPVIDICYGNKVTLTFDGTDDILWNTGDSSRSISFIPAGTGQYWVQAKNCKPYGDTVQVAVHPLPKADAIFTPDSGFAPLTIAGLSKNNKAYYYWVVGKDTTRNQPLTHEFQKPGEYEILYVYIDSFGCLDSLRSRILVKKAPDFEVPNVFTPADKDAFNNTFGIYNFTAGQFITFKMEVFNRWGQLMFSSNDANMTWDGTYQGKEATEGAYYYLVTAEQQDHKVIVKKGTITLIR